MIFARGIDISRYNISFDPTKATIPIDFVIQKATEGTSYVDTSYNLLWNGVQQIPIRGAYHYQRSGMSWVAQADFFLETQARHDYQILALDLESYGNSYSDTFFADTKRIIDHWRQYAPRQKTILYTNFDGYKQLYYSLINSYGMSIIQWLDNVPLWLASPGIAGSVPLSAYRKTWEIHQYSWSGLPSLYGTGGTRVDENVYNGTVEQMNVWLGLSGTIPIPPDIGGEMKVAVILTGLNIRNGPGTSYDDIGDLRVGDAIFGDLDTVSNWFHLNKIIRKAGGTEIVDGWASATSPAYMTHVDLPASSPTNPTTVDSTDVWKDDTGNVLATYKGILTKQ